MKKIALFVFVTTLLVLASCSENTTEITVGAKYQEVLQNYNFVEMAESFVEDEDGSIVYTIVDSNLSTIREETKNRLATIVEGFVTSIKEQNSDIVIDITFSEDGTVLEGDVTDAAGATNGMVFLILQAYPDIVFTQILAGIEPAGLTLKMTDPVTAEVFNQEIPF